MTCMVEEACLPAVLVTGWWGTTPGFTTASTCTTEPGLTGVRSFILERACPCCCARHPSELDVPDSNTMPHLRTRTSQLSLMPLHAGCMMATQVAGQRWQGHVMPSAQTSLTQHCRSCTADLEFTWAVAWQACLQGGALGTNINSIVFHMPLAGS